MDGLPTELVKLCRLASMAECGDHLWEAAAPAIGVWTQLGKRWAGWRAASGDMARNAHAENLRAEV